MIKTSQPLYSDNDKHKVNILDHLADKQRGSDFLNVTYHDRTS